MRRALRRANAVFDVDLFHRRVRRAVGEVDNLRFPRASRARFGRFQASVKAIMSASTGAVAAGIGRAGLPLKIGSELFFSNFLGHLASGAAQRVSPALPLRRATRIAWALRNQTNEMPWNNP